jgi:protein-S-isoprenylcysteine O-methyltransferase Ste14
MGRRVVTAVFGVVSLAVGVLAVEAVDTAIRRGSAGSWAAAVYELLRFGVVFAFAVLVTVRGESLRPSRAPIALGACAAALISFAVLSRPDASGPSGHVIAGDALAAVSEAWLLVSVLALGRCFGILPEARGLVVRGPYRLVRHPVYLGELGALAGFIIAAPSARNLAVAPVAVASQLVRINLEERELAVHFPAYRDYAARTPMLLPMPRRRGRARAAVSASRLALSALSTATRKGGTSES